MRGLKNWTAALTIGAMAVFAGGSDVSAADKGFVGIAMPTKSSARWIADGDNMVKVFTEKGYATDLQYAEDDIPNQLAQIENMVTKGVKVLVIAAIDGTTLSAILQQAHDSGIKVIAYDRLIRDTPNVDYYATFDNFQVGVIQANSIVDGLGLKDGKGPFNIELFGGSPDDNNAFFFYDGAMSVLQPYIDSGKLVVRSKQTGMNKVGTLRWDGSVAQARMDNVIRVPQRAVAQSTLGQTVMVVDQEGKVAVRPIKTSGMSGTDWIVIDGLAQGEKVIVNGLQKARPGGMVKANVVTPDAALAPLSKEAVVKPAATDAAARKGD